MKKPKVKIQSMRQKKFDVVRHYLLISLLISEAKREVKDGRMHGAPTPRKAI